MSKVLVIGCGGSGTHFTTGVLQSVGLQVGHEVEGIDGTVDWHKTTLDRVELRKYAHIFHQVREPMSVITFAQSFLPQSWAFVGEHMDLDRFGTHPIERAAFYWLTWNRIAERKASLTYKVEDMEAVLPIILNALGLEPGPDTENWLKHCNVGSRKAHTRPVTFEMLQEQNASLSRYVKRAAKLYGYEL